jgi:hypothetical protein
MVAKSTTMKNDVKQTAKKVEYSPLVEALVRVGYGVRGLIYFLIGLLALKVALGKGGQLASQQEAIASIGKSTLGMLLLWVVLLGLISYALWGVIRAVLDPLHKGHDLKGLMERAGFLVSAFGYAILIVPTLNYITGKAQSGSGSQNAIAKIISMPIGRWVIGIVGLAVIAGGCYQIYLGIKSHFDRQFQIYDMTKEQAKVAINVARYGTAARGVVFAVMGGLLVLAAYNANPNQQVGMDSALEAVLELPYGSWLLAVIAVGLIAFGIYSFMSALWFRIKHQEA